MGYYINPTEMMGMFPVPNSVIDKHLKLADPIYIKVLLYFLRNATANFDETVVANELKLSPIQVSEAMLYWIDAGILCSTESIVPKNDAEKSQKKPSPQKIIKGGIKPDRDEVTARGLECPEIAFILKETQLKFGRGLTNSELSTLVWLYDNQGIAPSLLMMIVGYAVSEGRANMGFIERTAVEWVTDGVSDVVTAENRLTQMRRRSSAWHKVETAMGIEHRQPSKSEAETADKWINEWNYDRDILRAAYDACVDTTSKFSFPYVKKILAEWHKNGVKTLEDVQKLAESYEQTTQKQGNKNKYDDFVNNLILKTEEE